MIRSRKEREVLAVLRERGFITRYDVDKVYATGGAARRCMEHLYKEGFMRLDGSSVGVLRFVWTGKEA